MFKCRVLSCGRIFPTHLALMQHKRDLHTSGTTACQTSANSTVFNCRASGCGQSFATHQGLLAHGGIHRKAEFRCGLSGCGRTLSTHQGLLDHRRVQHRNVPPQASPTPIKYVLCKFHNCNRHFASQDDMQKHFTATHSNPHPLVVQHPVHVA